MLWLSARKSSMMKNRLLSLRAILRSIAWNSAAWRSIQLFPAIPCISCHVMSCHAMSCHAMHSLALDWRIALDTTPESLFGAYMVGHSTLLLGCVITRPYDARLPASISTSNLVVFAVYGWYHSLWMPRRQRKKWIVYLLGALPQTVWLYVSPIFALP